MINIIPHYDSVKFNDPKILPKIYHSNSGIPTIQMSLNVPFNGSLRFIYTSSGSDKGETLFATIKSYASIMIGEVPIEWISGGHGQRGYCNSSICSSSFFQSIQSGLNDASFFPEVLDRFSLVPENMSFSSMMVSESCGFVNLYTDKSVKSQYLGILTSFQIIELNVYILVGLLTAIGAFIYAVHEKSLPWPFRGTTRQLINGRFGFVILATCYLAIFCVSQLLSSSFTTNYSIASRATPLIYLDDIKKSTQSVVGVDNLYCSLKSKGDSYLSHRIKRVESDKSANYIYDSLWDGRIVYFDSSLTYKTLNKVFCNIMINVKKSTDFYIINGNCRYFDTSRSLVYHKYIEKSKKRFLQRAAYSCLEMGYCHDAFDWAISKVAMKRVKSYKTNAQCENYKQIESYPVLYHPIALITIEDLIYLFAFLSSLSCFVLIIEFLRESKCNKPIQPV